MQKIISKQFNISKLTVWTLFIITVLLNSCRKDSLKKHYQELNGTWDWTNTGGGESGSGNGTPASNGYTLKLVLFEKGKYKLYKNNHKVDNGRLVDQGHIRFVSDDIYKKDYSIDGYEIYEVSSGIINIEQANCFDCFYLMFSKRH